MEKRCPQCDEVKSIDNFGFCKQKGTKTYCKKCYSENAKNYRDKNKDKSKTYRDKNKDRQKKYNEQYYMNNRDDIKYSSMIYYYNNREYKLEYTKQYNKENREKIKNYRKKRDLENPHIPIWRSILKNTIKRMNKPKSNSTIRMLGYSAEELRYHISSLFTPGMSWENYGEWHIDHIKPVCSFDPKTPVSTVCALSNLQPLWATSREIDGIIYEGNLNKNKFYKNN